MTIDTFPARPQEHVFERVLACYKPHCRYLRSLELHQEDSLLRATADLSVPEPCYIDATGHLNAVDVTICYNQMLYQVLALAMQHQLVPEFEGWTIEDFWRKQLPDVLISHIESSYRSPIDSRSFSGTFTVDRSTIRRIDRLERPIVWLETGFTCADPAGGYCEGAATIAIVGK